MWQALWVSVCVWSHICLGSYKGVCLRVRGVMRAVVPAVPALINDTETPKAARIQSICEHVCASDSEKGKKRNISYLRKHLLLVQEKQPAARALGPLLQHQREMFDAFD